MCAAIRASSLSSPEGVQKINDPWRLYMKDPTSRLELCLKQSIMVKGKKVALYDNNPYTSRQPSPDQFNGAPQQQNDKLTICDRELLTRFLAWTEHAGSVADGDNRDNTSGGKQA